MAEELLVVVDMQNDFVAENGALGFPEAREIVPFVVEKVKEFLANGKKVLFTLDTHQPDDKEFLRWPPHCISGSWGHQLIPELEAIKKQAGEKAITVEKSRYSAFFNTGLDDILNLTGENAFRPDKVYFTGVATNICVFFSMADFANRDIPVAVYRKGVASFDAQAHKFMLEQMKQVLGAEVL